ncbi:hypothetical protein MetMK1DRAFT_00015580 [Metallosphaera yellowstonensis MK1]|uniref:Uncharacterized protein n=1 Tax=Metallosphaera yellowstonensis MK1 TaxID=671065 RepID=H2C4N6_9CREN|nr:hypothetical protein MetMK1DRAFT_00015580 [Metallosphaera yellowstonensis MK1]
MGFFVRCSLKVKAKSSNCWKWKLAKLSRTLERITRFLNAIRHEVDEDSSGALDPRFSSSCRFQENRNYATFPQRLPHVMGNLITVVSNLSRTQLYG